MSSLPTLRLIDALPSHAPLHCLGIHDGVSLAAAEAAGASALYISGYALAASMLGLPDTGLITQTEMSEAIARLCGQTCLPVVADADSGYGDAANAARTMRLWERAGVSALHIEDQMFPKSCAQTHNVALVSAVTMCERLSAMLDARRNADTWLIARTDAMLCETTDEVLDRCEKYAASGVDALFINAPQSAEKLSYIARRLAPSNLPLIFNAVRSAHTPDVDDKTLHSLGVRVVLHPVAAMVEASQRMSEVYSALVQRQPVSSSQGLASLTALINRSALVDV